MKFVLYYKVKQTKTNPHKNFHLSSFNHLIYAHVQLRQSKKVAEISNFNEDDSALMPHRLGWKTFFMLVSLYVT